MTGLDDNSDNENLELDEPNDDPFIHGDFLGSYHGLGTRLGDFGGRSASMLVV